MASSLSDFPSAAHCAPISVVALEVLADLRRWVAEHPVALKSTPMVAMAISEAVISPWCNQGDPQSRSSRSVRCWVVLGDCGVLGG